MAEFLTEVERVENPTVERFVAEYLRPQKPVVMTKTLDAWPALAKWNFDYLTKAAGSKEFRVEAVTEREKAGYFGRQSVPRLIQLGEYIRQVVQSTEPPKLYMGGISVSGQLPEIAADVRITPYIQGKERSDAYLWLGAANTNTQLHYDINNNCHALFRGRKTFILFPPDQAKYLYPTSLFSPRRHFSQVRLEDPDNPRFPKLELAKGCQASLGPGDLLFLPSLWWHEVRTHEPSIAVNYWWGLNNYGDKTQYLYVRELPLMWWNSGKAGVRWRIRQLTGK